MARNYRFFLRNADSAKLLQQHKDAVHLSEDMEPEIIFQLVKVLRVKPGDLVTLIPSNSGGHSDADAGGGIFHEYIFEVVTASKTALELLPKDVRTNSNELSFNLNLLLCLPNKPDKLEFILQKSVEIGVKNITLLESDFSQMKHQLRMDRLQKIIIEAAEQSERAAVPTLTVQGNLTKFLTSAAAPENIWVAVERLNGLGRPNGKASSNLNPFASNDLKKGITILVGPEGGFSEAEKKLFDDLHLHAFSLGKRILRMETAAVVSLGLAAFLDA